MFNQFGPLDSEKMTRLSVNLNKMALLRNARGRDYPNLLVMAGRCIDAGAHGITIHPRPDQRHATYQDAYDLRALTRQREIELNIEGYPVDRFMDVVQEVKPEQCTLVPDDPHQLTSDHGWDVLTNIGRLRPIVETLQREGIRVSLFLDPDPVQVRAAPATGTDRIELYTEAYASAYASAHGRNGAERSWQQYRDAVELAVDEGLGVNAGHDLDLDNLARFLEIPNILEVSIGHALTVEAFDFGLEGTIQRYLKICGMSQ